MDTIEQLRVYADIVRADVQMLTAPELVGADLNEGYLEALTGRDMQIAATLKQYKVWIAKRKTDVRVEQFAKWAKTVVYAAEFNSFVFSVLSDADNGMIDDDDYDEAVNLGNEISKIFVGAFWSAGDAERDDNLFYMGSLIASGISFAWYIDLVIIAIASLDQETYEEFNIVSKVNALRLLHDVLVELREVTA